MIQNSPQSKYTVAKFNKENHRPINFTKLYEKYFSKVHQQSYLILREINISLNNNKLYATFYVN